MALISILALPALFGQAFTPLTFTVTQGGATTTLLPGNAINISGGGGAQEAFATFTVTYRGSTRVVFQQVTVAGSPDLQLRNPPPDKLQLTPGQSVSFDVVFTAKTATRATGNLVIFYQEEQANGTLGPTLSANFPIVATTTDLVLAYNSAVGVVTVNDGGSISFPATVVGATVAVPVALQNRGSTPVTVSSINVSGDPFIIAGLSSLPTTIDPGRSLNFVIGYKPSAVKSDSGTLTIAANGRNMVIRLDGSGVEPQIVVSYISPVTGNVTGVEPNGTIVFPAAPVNTVNTITVSVLNRSPGQVTVNSVTAEGEGFSIQALPLLPATLDNGRDVRFNLRFQFKDITPKSGTLTVVVNDKPLKFNLSATNTGPVFVYELLQGDTVKTFAPGTPLVLDDTTIGDRQDQSVRVRNTGNGDGQITSISITGAGWAVSDLPLLPLTLSPGSATIFTLTFAPVQAGRAAGRLRVGNEIFDVVSNGLGVRLTFSYTATVNQAPVDVAPQGAIVFTPARVGESSSATFTIRNRGTTAATVASITADPKGSFRLDPIALPVRIDPENTYAFPIRFSPSNIGPIVETLRIDGQPFALNGSGSRPVDLPDYDIQAPSGAVDPLQQPSVSLSLKNTYPLDLTGNLRLNVDSQSFAIDPAVQFATGGVLVNFTVPAGSRNAVFSNSSTVVRLQTGTVAGTITLTPTFMTSAGLNVTPDAVKTVSMTIDQAAPRLLSLQLGNRVGNTFSIVLTGYATGRTLKQLDFDFTAVPDRVVGNSKVTVDVEGPSGIWFRSGRSTGFGGLFATTIAFSLAGPNLPPAKTGQPVPSLVDFLRAITVSATNDRGKSNPVRLDLP